MSEAGQCNQCHLVAVSPTTRRCYNHLGLSNPIKPHQAGIIGQFVLDNPEAVLVIRPTMAD